MSIGEYNYTLVKMFPEIYWINEKSRIKFNSQEEVIDFLAAYILDCGYNNQSVYIKFYERYLIYFRSSLGYIPVFLLKEHSKIKTSSFSDFIALTLPSINTFSCEEIRHLIAEKIKEKDRALFDYLLSRGN
jgi:hypothetical protein